MRIVIVGGGVVGLSLAEQLMFENHDVSLVEKDQEVIHLIAKNFAEFVLFAWMRRIRLISTSPSDASSAYSHWLTPC